jgi:hypothetical protein
MNDFSLQLVALGPALAMIAGLFASFFSAGHRSGRKVWHLAALIAAPAAVSVVGALGESLPDGGLVPRLGVALIAVLVCVGSFAFAYAFGASVRALWRSIRPVKAGRSEL